MANKPNFENIRVSEREFDLYFNEDYIFKDLESVRLLQKTIFEYARVFFGVNEANLSDLIVDGITEKLKIKYSTLTFSQLKYAFMSQEIVKKEFSAMSIDEFVRVIDFWSRRRAQIANAILEVEEIERKKQAEEQNRINFENRCREIWKLSVSKSEWVGDIFEAMWCLKNIPNSLDREYKQQVWDDCKAKYSEALKLRMNPYEKVLIKNPEQLYAEVLIKKTIQDASILTKSTQYIKTELKCVKSL